MLFKPFSAAVDFVAFAAAARISLSLSPIKALFVHLTVQENGTYRILRPAFAIDSAILMQLINESLRIVK